MRKFLNIIIILVITIYGCNLVCFAEDEQNKSKEPDLATLQSLQKELQSKLGQEDSKLTVLQDELTENLQEIQALDSQIEQAKKEIEESSKKIDKLKIKNLHLEEKLKTAREKYNKQKDLLEARLVAMYESGEVQYLDVILSSSDIVEFLSNYLLIDEIITNDNNFLNEVKQKKQIIELASENLNDNIQKQKIIKENQEKNVKVLENIQKLRQKYIEKLTNEEKNIQNQIDTYKSEFQKVNKEILDIAISDGLLDNYVGGALIWPVPGYSQITSSYGMRTHPITGYYSLHTGVDIGAPMGADFVAANDGIVTKAYYNNAYGNMVMIDHGGGISTLYAHGSEILVNVGQPVKKNEPVLKIGSTGYSTGPHAHFEVRLNGNVTDPIDFITKDKTPEEVLKEQIINLGGNL